MATIPKKPSRWWSIAIGAGVALSPVHNQYLTHLLTNANGETLFFLPAFGYLLLIMGAGLFLLNHWDKVKAIGWGDQRIVGCLLFIVLAISASGAAYTGLQDRFAPMGMGLALFALYLCGRILGKDMFLPLAVGAAIASLGVIAHQIVYPGVITGGFVFEGNYDIVVGYVLLGAALYYGKWRLPLISLGLVAILLTGSPEGVFVLFVVGLVYFIRRDWKKPTLLTTVALVAVSIIVLTVGWRVGLYDYAMSIPSESLVQPTNQGTRQAIGYRLDVVWFEMTHIEPLGTGYSITDFNDKVLDGELRRIVHNVPLVLVQQLGWPGILAAMAWLWVSIHCLVRTQWKYAWIAILALSVFDHFIWTQLAPVYWILVGVSTAPDNIQSDLLFKKYFQK